MNAPPTGIPIQRRLALLALAAPWAGSGGAAETAASRPVAWPLTRPTPPLQLPGYEGPPLSLAALRGKPVLLNFWASWCEPCRSEMPTLELLATRFEAQGLQVLAINFRETDAALRRYTEATPLSLPIGRDRDGAAAQAFGVRTFPSTIAINRQGRAVFSFVGEADWNAEPARGWVAELL